jgi:hypothetical protein
MTLRLCSYNVEWFNHLFNKDNSLKNGEKEQKRIKALHNVFEHIRADFVGILEAPNSSSDGKESTIKKLENFAQSKNLPVGKALTGYISGGNQEIAVMYNPDKLSVEHSPGGKSNSKSNPPFDGEFYFDTDEDRIKELYKHYRPPLEVQVIGKNNNVRFKVIVAHTKSKGIYDSIDIIRWERESIRNRLKLFAECEWIRRRVEEWLEDGSEVVVMGDFNDGPGMDYYELKYGRSAIEIIMGDVFEPDLILRSYMGRPKWTSNGWKPASARFKDRMTESYVNVVIDHILISSGLSGAGELVYKVWNPFEEEEAKPIKNDLLIASDHFPITLDLDI